MKNIISLEKAVKIVEDVDNWKLNDYSYFGFGDSPSPDKIWHYEHALEYIATLDFGEEPLNISLSKSFFGLAYYLDIHMYGRGSKETMYLFSSYVFNNNYKKIFKKIFEKSRDEFLERDKKNKDAWLKDISKKLYDKGL